MSDQFNMDAAQNALGAAESAMAALRAQLDSVWAEIRKLQKPNPTGPIKS